MLRTSALSVFLGLGLLACVTLVGCESSGGHSMNDMDSKGVMCDKCKTTWVRDNHDHGRVTGYSSKGSMTCPECKSAVANFFETGKLEHACKSCGGEMTMCESH